MIYIYIYIYIFGNIYMCMCVCVCVCVYIYIYIYIILYSGALVVNPQGRGTESFTINEALPLFTSHYLPLALGAYLMICMPSVSWRNRFSKGGSPEFSVVRGLSWMTSSISIGHAATASKPSSSSICDRQKKERNNTGYWLWPILEQDIVLRGRALMVQWVVGSVLRGVDPLSCFSFQPVFHDWCNKGRGVYYSVCGMMHIKEPLLLIRKSSLCGGSGFFLSLSEWSFTVSDAI